jgi:hypothetical protein
MPNTLQSSDSDSDSGSVGSLGDVSFNLSSRSASPVPSGPSSPVSISSAPSSAGDEEEALRERRRSLYCHYEVRDTSQIVIENKRKAFPEDKKEGSCEMFRYYYSKESDGIQEVGGGIPLLLIDYITLAEKSSDEKNSTNDDSPSVKFGKAWIKNQNIGDDCTVGGWLHWFDVPNNTRVHIDEEGAKDIENYRIFVEDYFFKLLQR